MIKEFSIGCSRTVNLGNFESLRIEASVTIDVPPADGDTNFTPDLVSLEEAAQIELRALLEETYRQQFKPKTRNHET